MTLAWTLLAALAVAQESPPPEARPPVPVLPAGEGPLPQPVPPSEPLDPHADEVMLGEVPVTTLPGREPEYIEVLVIGEQVIAAARDQVVRRMASVGWTARSLPDGRIRFRGPERWMGRATLLPSGDLEFDTPTVAFGGQKPTDGHYTPDAPLENRVNVGTVGPRFDTFSRDKVAAAQREVRDAVHADVLDYRRKLQQRHFSSYVAELPARLDAVWERGVPLGGGRTLDTPEARRADILEFWATRTDTPEGRTVMRTVELWLREVAMDSPHPVTAAEAAAAELRRSDNRRLDLF